jgi:hypothetical protein
MLFEHFRSNLECLQKIEKKQENNIKSNLVHEINDRTALQLRSDFTKLLESDEARVRVAQNTMTVSDLAKSQLG